MADDIFGDDALFAEFDRDREQQKIFIHYDKDESGIENRSRIIFNNAESESDESDIEILSSPSDALNVGFDHVPTQLEDLQKLNDNGQPKESQSDERAGEDEMTSDSVKSDEKKGYDTSDQCSQPQTTTYKEQFEKSKLRTFAKLIDSTRYISDEESPGVQIIFHNNQFANKYRGKIEQFLIDIMHHAENKDFCNPAVDLSCQPRSVLTCVDINDTLPAEKRTKSVWQIHGIIGCAKYHHSFMVDAQGWSQEAGGESMETVYGEMPKYQQVFQQVFPVDEIASADENKIAKPKTSCFNCGGDHRLNECKTPKDHERIRNKRREHQDKNAAKNSNPGRYHEDPELNPNQKKFEAGQISDSLREAMGLKPNQLPTYIYRMRLFGYPPGWLMEANRKSLNLAMYDKDGHETNICGESLEDGECVDQANGTEVFDINKIIEYPGFTIPVPQGFIDESALIGMPPVQEHQLKKTLMEDIVVKQEKNKKRRLEEEEDAKVKKARAEDMDMDDEDDACHDGSSPWVSAQIKEMIKERYKRYRLWKKTGSKRHLEIMKDLKSVIRRTLKHAKYEWVKQLKGKDLEEASQAVDDVIAAHSSRGKRKDKSAEDDVAGDKMVSILDEMGEGDCRSQDTVLQENTPLKATCACAANVLPTPEPGDSQSGSVSESPASAVLGADVFSREAIPKSPTKSQSELLREKNFSYTPSTSISKDYGTPISMRQNSFHLPQPEKFRQGIEDHIPYENLPGSVGTFDRMRNVFSMIREKFKKK